MSDKYSLNDLVNFTSESKPLDFETAFDSIIKDRIADRIDFIKQDIAKNIFNKGQEEGTEEDGEEDQVA